MQQIKANQDVTIQPWERVDDLQFKGLRIIQNPKAFCFGMDAVLLASFVKIRKGDKVVDFGTGTGILPLLLHGRFPENEFSAFEVQQKMSDMATRSVLLNGLADKIAVYGEDLRQAPKILTHLSRQVVVCNPPYGKSGSTMESRETSIRLARHEEEGLLKDIIRSAQLLLKNHGRLYMIFPTQRMVELIDAMRSEKIEPKRMRFIYPKVSKAPNLFLIEGIKGAKPGILWENPLIIYHENGEETQELKEIYHKNT